MEARWIVNALVALAALAVAWLALLLLAVRAEYLRRMETSDAGSTLAADGSRDQRLPGSSSVPPAA